MHQWGLPGTTADYEEDHLMSLELGASPTDPRGTYDRKHMPPCRVPRRRTSLSTTRGIPGFQFLACLFLSQGHKPVWLAPSVRLVKEFALRVVIRLGRRLPLGLA